MADQNGTAADRPLGEQSPSGRPAAAAGVEDTSEKTPEDAPLADRLEVHPERGDVKG